MKTLNTHLEGKKFLVGNGVTLSDLELFLILRGYFNLIFTEEDRKHFANVTSWFDNIANEPNVLEICGVSRHGRVTQKGPRKFEQPKPQVQKPAEKKPEPKKEETKGGEEEEEAPKSKGKKHPLDELPPTSFVLDVFKKDFLNTPDKKGAMERFWAAYDKNGYSLWLVSYNKLPSEGKVLFKTCNYYSMFLQKMENFRKYTFSSHGVYGDEGNFEIRGLWMWRGTEMAPQMQEHDAFEYHTFKKLDSTNENDRKVVEDYWLHTNPGDVADGLKVQEVVYFR
jgi:elongation factor 1-gamma